MVIILFYEESEWCYSDNIKSFQPWPTVGSLCFKIPGQKLEIQRRVLRMSIVLPKAILAIYGFGILSANSANT